MSSIKKTIEDIEAKQEAMVETLIKVGYIKRCPEHDHIVIVTGNFSLREATDHCHYYHWRDYVDDCFKFKEVVIEIERVAKHPDLSNHRCPECDRLKSKG